MHDLQEILGTNLPLNTEVHIYSLLKSVQVWISRLYSKLNYHFLLLCGSSHISIC